MTLISFDLVSDFDGSIKSTSSDVSFESAVVNAIHNLGHTLLTSENESGLLDCRLINSQTGELENEFVSYSVESANIEALTILGHTVYESLTDAEWNSIKTSFGEDDGEFDDLLDEMEEIEEGKVVAFSFEL